jgi:mannose-6-phosphate isomerase-like protein (cupin superfamily)
MIAQSGEISMHLEIVAVLLAAIALQAGGERVHVWKASELKGHGEALARTLDPQTKLASETLVTEGNRTFMMAHREGPGAAEWHEMQADVMFIISGEVTMVYGGSVVDGKTTQPGEIRGSAIRDGVEVKLGPGDVLHIPAKTPHQMKLDSGKEVTYFVTKVVE